MRSLHLLLLLGSFFLFDALPSSVQSKPLSEAAEDPNSKVDKWITDWDLLMHAISELSNQTASNEIAMGYHDYDNNHVY